MKKKIILTLLSVFLLGGTCAHPVIMFDETHAPLHSISDPNGYGPLVQLLQDNNYIVRTQTDASEWLNISEDVDIIVIAVPTVTVENGFILAIIEDWVFNGGKLVVITDHQPYPAKIKPLANLFGLDVRNSTITHSAGHHCPPGESICLAGQFTFTKEDGGHTILGENWFTTYAGSSFKIIDPDVIMTPILTYMPTARDVITGEDAVGECAGIIVEHGAGRVYFTSEAGSWTCRNNGTGMVGFCTESGQRNDDFILTILLALRLGPSVY